MHKMGNTHAKILQTPQGGKNMNTKEKYEARIKSMREYTYQWDASAYEDPSRPILKITKSSLGSHVWCPKKYDFGYIQRLPQDQSEAMRKGTILHNHREAFFNDFDLKKAQDLSADEVINYCTGLFPIDEYFDISMNVAAFEAQRYIEARTDEKTHEFLPIVNEGKFDAEITIPHNISKKYPLKRDYVIHIQGIIDRIFIENGNLIPFEFKTGPWKDYKSSSMRQEMAFYQMLIEYATDEVLEQNGLTRDMKVTHWGWYYPVSNYVFVEPIKKRTMTSVKDNIAKLIKAYEEENFPTKFYFKTCAHCSYFGICEGAQDDTWV